MKNSELENLTNNQIREHQRTIQDSLIIDVPILNELLKKVNKLKSKTYQLQTEYRELDKELYLRTKEIKIIRPKKKRKQTAKKDSAKVIDKLIKELGSEQVKQMLEQISQSQNKEV